MQLVLHTSSENGGPGDFEFMATRVPYGVVTGRDPGDTQLSMRTTLSRPVGRGELSFSSTNARTAVRINPQRLGAEQDLVALARLSAWGANCSDPRSSHR